MRIIERRCVVVMNKKQEKLFGKRMTKRLEMYLAIAKDGDFNKHWYSCNVCVGACLDCPLYPCTDSWANNRGYLFGDSYNIFTEKKYAKLHFEALIKKLDASGWVYE